MSRPLPSVAAALDILKHKRTRRAPRPAPSVSRPITPILSHLEKKFAGQDLGIHGLSLRWSEIVGATLGRICEPVKIVRAKSSQILEIRVSGAYAALLQHQTGVLLDRIHLYLGRKEIEKLRFVQGPLSQKQNDPVNPRHRPLSATEEMALKQSVEHILDEKLQKTLLNLGRCVLQKEKIALK
jgi:hypothetical protein